MKKYRRKEMQCSGASQIEDSQHLKKTDVSKNHCLMAKKLGGAQCRDPSRIYTQGQRALALRCSTLKGSRSFDL